MTESQQAGQKHPHIERFFVFMGVLATALGVITGCYFVFERGAGLVKNWTVTRPWVTSADEIKISSGQRELPEFILASTIRIDAGIYDLAMDSRWIANEILMEPNTVLRTVRSTLVGQVIEGGRILANGVHGAQPGESGGNGGFLLLVTSSRANVQIEATGGNGTVGERGAPGLDGRNGKCDGFGGYRAAQAGRPGSSGGLGGNAGNGGTVIVYAPLPPVIEPITAAGLPGAGGPGGPGGRGGRGCTGLGGSQPTRGDGLPGEDGSQGAFGEEGVYQFNSVSPELLGTRIRTIEDHRSVNLMELLDRL